MFIDNDVIFENLDDSDLINEVESRGYTVEDKFTVSKTVYVDTKEVPSYHFTLSKCYSSIELRDLLLDIIGKGHYITNDELIDELKNLLNK